MFHVSASAHAAGDEISAKEVAVKCLEEEIHKINNMKDIPDQYITPELEKLQTENCKLKYQIQHLKKNIAIEEAKSGDFMMSFHEVVTSLFQEAARCAYPDVSEPVMVTPSTKENFGDYQCNSAMALAKIFKQQGKTLSPRDIAKEIVSRIPENKVIAQMDIAGPGFINVSLQKDIASQEILQLVIKGARPPNTGKSKKIVVDMSSPNIAKEMHVGHLRSTIIGNAISELCQFLGHKVLKVNHLGDWGTQFGMLIAHLQEKFPDYKTVSPPISDLQAFYKESKKRFDEEEEFKKRAYDAVVKLQSDDPDFKKAWTLICDVSKQEFTKIYERLNIKELIDRGESFYQDRMSKTIEELDKLGATIIEDGRKIAWAPDTTVPLTLVKSDGGYTYDSTDMAAIKHRLQEDQADWIIYVIDQGQSLHMQTIFGVAKKVGWYDPNEARVEHIGFGVVLGEDKKKFKTRSGDTVRLVDLLDEGVKRAYDKLQEKGRQEVLTADELKKAAEALAYGCIKYSDLCHNRINDYVFSFDKMLEDRGNTAVYLQYAYMRIRSISRLADVKYDAIVAAAKDGQVSLEHPKEWKLAKALLRWPEVVSRVLTDFSMHLICEYLYELSGIFTEFYDACYVVEKDRTSGEIIKINMERLVLCEAAATVMESAFKIVGIQTVERM